jgi:D-alanine--poly(phosphoribitol) ligase subunit 1
LPPTAAFECEADVSELWQAFERAAHLRGDAPALAMADGDVSFKTLHRDAMRCGSWLASNVSAGRCVALQLPKRRETYALWLGCLRQGMTYVFVDPRNPPSRTVRILDRVKPEVLFSVVDAPNPYGHAVALPSDQDGSDWLGALPTGAVPAPAPTHGLDPAYVMFTSGSTGEPKGAVIPCQGVLSLMKWGRTLCNPESSRFSNVNPLHFDNSVFDLYCGLLNGATLVPVETGNMTNPAHWVRRLREGGANVIFAVPTLFQTLMQLRLLKPDNLPDARLFIFGGEGFPVPALQAFRERFEGHARLVNVYGPTETSCICSSLEIDQASLESAKGAFPSLGRMHSDFSHLVLDQDGSEVPRGSPGELWIGGPNVGLGYMANPEETARRFRQDPRQNSYRSIWYRSGDLVREDENHLLWFQGRVDNQVKVRGHRIELEEIDLVLEGLESVSRAVAMIRAGDDGPEIWAAFVAREKILAEQTAAHCRAALPAYMQPARIVQLEILPTNANGKVDRRATLELLESLP